MAERILSILKIADKPLDSGEIRSADEVESLLVDELRKLGNESLSTWAGGVDENVSLAYKAENPQAQLREKNFNWWTRFDLVEVATVSGVRPAAHTYDR